VSAGYGIDGPSGFSEVIVSGVDFVFGGLLAEDEAGLGDFNFEHLEGEGLGVYLAAGFGVDGPRGAALDLGKGVALVGGDEWQSVHGRSEAVNYPHVNTLPESFSRVLGQRGA
jgi:hypothetical protein